jgi:hypothetical protein
MYLWSCGTLKRFNSSTYSSLKLFRRNALETFLPGESAHNAAAVSVIIWRSYGAYRDLDSDNYKDFAPAEHDLDLPNVQTPNWSLDIFL